MSKPIDIRSKEAQGAEVSWFAPICDGDDRYLGERNVKYKSNWENSSNVLLAADQLGYRNILCPSSYQVGQDTLPFVSAVSPMIQKINILAAVRCGEIHPPMLARTLSTIDHILKGRLTINIISSNLPGEELSPKIDINDPERSLKYSNKHGQKRKLISTVSFISLNFLQTL